MMIRQTSVLAVVLSVCSWYSLGAQESSIVESEVTSVNELVFTEGPAYHRDGSVFYTDIQNNRILRLAPGAAVADTF